MRWEVVWEELAMGVGRREEEEEEEVGGVGRSPCATCAYWRDLCCVLDLGIADERLRLYGMMTMSRTTRDGSVIIS